MRPRDDMPLLAALAGLTGCGSPGDAYVELSGWRALQFQDESRFSAWWSLEMGCAAGVPEGTVTVTNPHDEAVRVSIADVSAQADIVGLSEGEQAVLEPGDSLDLGVTVDGNSMTIYAFDVTSTAPIGFSSTSWTSHIELRAYSTDADDFDHDGYSAYWGCNAAAGPFDCDDDDESVYTGAPEVMDGVDNDCDGAIDEA